MQRPIQYGADFAAGLRANLEYLRKRGDVDWFELLETDLRELELLLSKFPTAGTLMACRGAMELRKLRLKRTPFVVWYVADIKITKSPVTFLRLYHARQRSTQPRF